MRCLFRLGCLVVLLVLGVVGWFTRDMWLPRLLGRPRNVNVVWTPVAPAGAARTRTALQDLSRETGPVFANLTGADVVAFILDSLAKGKQVPVDSLAATVIGDQLHVRGSVRTKDLGGATGSLASLLSDREPIEIAGTLHVPSRGVGELTVTDVRIRDYPLPKSAIRSVRARVGGTSDSTQSGSVRFTLPDYIGDVRIANGRITLYKTPR